MSAMQYLDQPFATEARAIMDRHDLPTEAFHQVRCSLAEQAFRAEIEPWANRLMLVKGLVMPSLVRHGDGRLEQSGDGMTEPMREMVQFCEAHIQEIRQKYEKMMGATSATPPAADDAGLGTPRTSSR